MKAVRILMLSLALALAGGVATAAAEPANGCLRLNWALADAMGPNVNKSSIIISQNRYFYYTAANVCPHPVVFHWCFYRIEGNTCGTRGSYYENAVGLSGFSQYKFKDPNPARAWGDEKTIRIEWVACKGSPPGGFPQPGQWEGARTCGS